MFELIFGNLVIRLLIGSAVAVLLAALALSLKSRLQVANTKRAERRVEQAKALALAIEKERVLGELEASVTASSNKATMPASSVKPAPVPAPTSQTPPAATETAPPTPESAPTETVNAAMQDILSSVFGDEEVTSHPEALLNELKELDASNLLEMANRIASQLNPDPATLNGKES